METAPAPDVELMSALSTLLEAGKYSDLTINCGRRRFPVHKAIICSRSGFFDGACSHAFREAESGVIDLGDDDDETVEHMINYFYHLDYLSKPKAKRRPRGLSIRSNKSNGAMSPTTSPAHTHRPSSPTLGRRRLNLALVEDPLLAAAAHNALSPELQASPAPSASSPASVEASTPHSPVCSVATHSSLHQDLSVFSKLSLKIPPLAPAVGDLDIDRWDEIETEQQEPNYHSAHLVTHSKVYAIAEKYGIAGLKSLARAKFASQISHHHGSSEFADAIQLVYDTTVDQDRGLRDVVIQTFREHPELAQRKDVERVVKETPNLAWELFRVGWGLPIV